MANHINELATPRFPRLSTHLVRDEVWHEVPLTPRQAIHLEDAYSTTLRRAGHEFGRPRCPRHTWLRYELGPWVCTECPEERWTPPGSETLKFGYGPHKIIIPPEMAERFVEEFKRRWIGEGHGTNEG